MALRDWVCKSDGFLAGALCSQGGGNVEDRTAAEDKEEEVEVAAEAAATGKA